MFLKMNKGTRKKSINDRDYFDWYVFCDGELVQYCISADEEQGIVTYFNWNKTHFRDICTKRGNVVLLKTESSIVLYCWREIMLILVNDKFDKDPNAIGNYRCTECGVELQLPSDNTELKVLCPVCNK